MYNDITRELEKQGFKLTIQRKSIIKTLLDYTDSHLSIEELYDLVKKEHSELGLTTVYRTVDILTDLGYILQLNFGDGRQRLEIKNKGLHQHHHLICTECKKVREFDEDLLERLEKRIARKHNFKVKDHSLKFYGLCAECAEHE